MNPFVHFLALVIGGPLRFERPKIIHNDTTRQYVRWRHYGGRRGGHGTRIGTGEAGAASCRTVN
jgi:hypothetical protein